MNVSLLDLFTLLVGGSGLAAAVVALLKWRSERNELEANASSKITAAALELLEPQAARIRLLEQRVGTLERELDEFKRGTRTLTRQLEDLGQEPLWRPCPAMPGRDVQDEP